MKHEKEAHEGRIYICMPDGATVDTEYGPACAICGETNPTSNHTKIHNMLPCLQRAPTARTYNRKYQFEKHLEESHGVRKGSAVAKQWQRECPKQAWACGFCVAYFEKSSSRFHHIATEHYKRGEDLSKWDPTKVILGLLRQPKVHKVWTERINLQFPNHDINLRWDRAPTDTLIDRLELGVRGQEDGTALAMAAFTESDYYRSRLESSRLPSSGSTSLQAVHREPRTHLGAVKGSHGPRNESGGYKRMESLLPTPDGSHTQSGWPQEPIRHVSGIAFREIAPGDEVSSGLSASVPGQMMRSGGENLKSDAGHMYPMADTGLTPRPAAMVPRSNDVSGIEANDTNFLLLGPSTDDFDFAQSNFAALPVLDQANLGMTTNDPTTSSLDIPTSSSSGEPGVFSERPVSPMDLDQYLDFGT